MKKVFKYKLEGVITHLKVSADHDIVHVGEQRGDYFAWVEVDETQTKKDALVDLILYVVGTGQPIPPNSSHHQSFQDGNFVWHIYIGNTGSKPTLRAV